VKVNLVPSSVTMRGEGQLAYLTSYVINDTLAIDAGGLGFWKDPFEQARIKHVLITHTHIDHIASLPIFVENVYEGNADCVTIHGSDSVLDCLQRDIFNDRVWPNFIRLSNPKAPFFKLSRLDAYKTLTLEGLRLTPIPVNHVVPTLGFIIEAGDHAIIIPSDTGPTEEIWERSNRHPNVKAVFLEAAFPNNMKWLADVSKHLTPAMFAAELQKLRQPVPSFAVHIKARFFTQIVAELRALELPHVDVGRFERDYYFQ
jgi:cAMP phosphodiesterase